MDREAVHNSGLDVILDPLPTEKNIFLDEPGAVIIRDRINEVEIRLNLAQTVSLINALTKIWQVSFYG